MTRDAHEPKVTMHEIRVAADKQVFHAAMEFWGRCDQVPSELTAVGNWIQKRDPLACLEAQQQIWAEAEAK